MSGKLQFLFSITASFILNNLLSPICKKRAQSELNKKPSRSSSSNANNGRKSSRFMNPTTTNREYRNLGRRFSVLYFSVTLPRSYANSETGAAIVYIASATWGEDDNPPRGVESGRRRASIFRASQCQRSVAHTTGIPSSVCVVHCAINGFIGDQINLITDKAIYSTVYYTNRGW